MYLYENLKKNLNILSRVSAILWKTWIFDDFVIIEFFNTFPWYISTTFTNEMYTIYICSYADTSHVLKSLKRSGT